MPAPKDDDPVQETDADTDTDSDSDTDTDADTDSDTDVTGSAIDPATLVGRTWELDYSSGTLVEGSSLLELDSVLIGVVAADETSMDLLLGIPDGAAQDLCGPTAPIPTADFVSNPLFGIGPTDWAQQIDGFDVSFLDFVFRGEFVADGTSVTRVGQSFALDAADVGPLIDMDANGLCGLLAILGTPCEDCPGGTPSTCTYLEFDDIPMIEVVGLTLEERTDADILADPNCK